MMKIVIDSNITIDALRPNPDFGTDAKRVFQLIWHEKIAPYICANSLTDIFYVLRKVHGAEKAKAAISNLITAADIIPLTENDCVDALALPMADFEDALIAVCAKRINADFIVSRDRKFIESGTDVEAITPRQLIEKINR
ncbi:MAG: PIN domain-containing protein [Clostridiales Family XIII bacterium]|jgi:predicted nucleic acid-binding protein|nr:PIN domain-containing protein [Clostridiales Family XIII bacterium]